MVRLPVSGRGGWRERDGPAYSEANSEALRLFYRAIELDPDFASAYGMAAYCFVWRKTNGWMTDRVQEITETARLARRAVELGRDDAVALSRGGHALAYVVGDLDSSAALIDRALVLNPNLAPGVLYGLSPGEYCVPQAVQMKACIGRMSLSHPQRTGMIGRIAQRSETMPKQVRRIVTGHDNNGKAVVISDAPAPFVHVNVVSLAPRIQRHSKSKSLLPRCAFGSFKGPSDL